ncbi:SRPBCC family protein [Phenylobacterium sp. LjRoot219]|uniref:SRPBCC family protein n=1 Tax=Phenylobacterium sp. LjRoot219 TaxID=3342283 RepID=UPI003ECD892A
MDFYIERTIHAAPEAVARIMFDPGREAEWMAKAGSAEPLTPGPMGVGSQVRHTAGVHGWPVSFVTEVRSFEPDRRLEMAVINATRQGEIIYQVAPTAGGSIATIHVRDDETGPHPVSNWARKQQAEENLARLASLVTHGHA